MYAKVAAAGDDPKKIVFFYSRDTLFNDVSLMSNYMSKNLSTKDGNALTDDYAISDDEREESVELWHMPDESLAPRVQPPGRLGDEPHWAEMPAEETALEQGEHENGPAQQPQPAKPFADGEGAEQAQDRTEARYD